MTKTILTVLRAIAECFARLSHGLGVCLSVTLLYCIKTVQARITKSTPWANPRTPFFVTKFRASVWRGYPRTRASKRGTSLKRRYFAVIGSRIVWKRLRIGTDMLLIITSTGHKFCSFINIGDLERPWTPKIRGIITTFKGTLDLERPWTL